MGIISINGTTFSGNNLDIIGGKVIIDGKEVTPDTSKSRILEVRIVEGTLDNLRSDVSVIAQNVKGSISAGTSVRCESVGGSVNAGTSVNCGRVGGSVNAGTSIRHA